MALFSFLKRKPGPTLANAAPARLAQAPAQSFPQEVVYPPVDQGLPALNPQLIVQAAHQKIGRLGELTVSDRDIFEAAYFAPIRRLAELVHLLPATSSDLYAAPAGLFNLCLDVAFYSLQSADGKIFTPDGTVEQRHKNEPRWRYATFLAGLSCQVFRSLTHITVVNDQGAEWPRFSQGLSQWLQSTGSQRYYINWHEAVADKGAEGAAVLAAIAPKERLDWLAQGDVQIVRDMHQVALGTAHQAQSIMAKVVKGIIERIEQADQASRRCRYGRLTVGTHIEPLILDAFRFLVESGQWKINTAGSPVWHGSDDLWVEWPAGNETVQEHFRASGLMGMPRSALTIAEILGKAGAVITTGESEFIQAMAVPAGTANRQTSGMRFARPEAVLGLNQSEPVARPFGASMVSALQNATAAAGVLEHAFTSPLSTPGAAVAPQAAVASPAIGSAVLPPSAQPPVKPQAGASSRSARQTAASTQAQIELPDEEGGEVSFASLIPQATQYWVKGDMAEVLGQMVHLQRQNRGEVAKTSIHGVALSTDWIAENSAVEVAKLAQLFSRRGWMGSPNGKASAAAHLHDVQFDDRVKKALFLNKEGAIQLGFAVGTSR